MKTKSKSSSGSKQSSSAGSKQSGNQGSSSGSASGSRSGGNQAGIQEQHVDAGRQNQKNDNKRSSRGR